MRYAVFDLGSNSIKCVMAETRSQGIRILHEESIGTRLAENLIDTCELRPEAIARTLDALRLIRAKADELGIERFRAVATSAVRDSRNRREFLRAAREVLGFPCGCYPGRRRPRPSSTASSLIRTGAARTSSFSISAAAARNGSRAAMASWKSGSVCPWVPCGCANGSLHEYPVAADTANLLVETIRGQIAHPLAHYTLGSRRLVGTGGTITCLVAIHKKLAHFDPKQIDHAALTLEQVRALQRSFTGMTLEKLRNLPGLPPKRADLILPGTAVVLATMETLGAKRLHVSVRGLRYGVLTAAIQEDQARAISPPGAHRMPRARATC